MSISLAFERLEAARNTFDLAEKCGHLHAVKRHVQRAIKAFESAMDEGDFNGAQPQLPIPAPVNLPRHAVLEGVVATPADFTPTPYDEEAEIAYHDIDDALAGNAEKAAAARAAVDPEWEPAT